MNDPAQDFWAEARRYTAARIGIGRSGTSIPTPAALAFERAVAAARDAVYHPFDADAVAQAAKGHACIRVDSRAPDRESYLKRPDLGRRLSEGSRTAVRQWADRPCDLLFVIADGLSPAATTRYALDVVLPCIERLPHWRIGPLVLARQARVALADEVAEVMAARMVAILLGERPGLATPNSLGLYLTWAPTVGTPDSRRNCISNIHDGGLAPATAARIAAWLIREAGSRKLSGTALKEAADLVELTTPTARISAAHVNAHDPP